MAVLSFFSSSAAASGAFLPAFAVENAETADVNGFAGIITQINDAMKGAHGVHPFLRVYAGDATGGEDPAVFILYPAGSFSVLGENRRTFENDAGLVALRSRFEAANRRGPLTLLKASRFDGTYAPGWLFNTHAVVVDEPACLAAIAALRGLFDDHEFADVRINVFRAICGRDAYTHLISLNVPSAERLAALLDAIASETWATEWFASSSNLYTVVRNGTFHEVAN